MNSHSILMNAPERAAASSAFTPENQKSPCQLPGGPAYCPGAQRRTRHSRFLTDPDLRPKACQHTSMASSAPLLRFSCFRWNSETAVLFRFSPLHRNSVVYEVTRGSTSLSLVPFVRLASCVLLLMPDRCSGGDHLLHGFPWPRCHTHLVLDRTTPPDCRICQCPPVPSTWGYTTRTRRCGSAATFMPKTGWETSPLAVTTGHCQQAAGAAQLAKARGQGQVDIPVHVKASWSYAEGTKARHPLSGDVRLGDRLTLQLGVRGAVRGTTSSQSPPPLLLTSPSRLRPNQTATKVF